MKVLGGGPAARQEKYATSLLHDAPGARVVAFHLIPGQRVPPHSSASTVLVHVTGGSGTFRGEDGEQVLHAGQTAVYEPGELHSMDALDGPLAFLAVIAPRPGG